MPRSEFITRIFGSPYELCAEAALQIVDEAAKAVYARDRFTLVLSGGATPKTVYQLLGTQYHDDITWNKTILILGDERFVPLDHPESNYRTVKETLLSKISIPEENVIYLKDTSENCIAEFENTIRTTLNLQQGTFPQFDLVMLGLGDDGHTASLFSNNIALKEQSAIATKVHVPEIDLGERMTLTIPAINNARKAIFLVTGKTKAKMVADIYDNPDCKSPATLIHLKDGELYWYLDLDSSSKISTEI